MRNLWINIALFSLLGAGISCILAFSSEQVRVVFSSFFNIFDRPFSTIHQRTSQYIQTMKRWAVKELQEEVNEKRSSSLYSFIGATFYSILTFIFLLCDWGMIVLTLQAWGMDAPKLRLPFSTSTLTAATLVTTSLFWGALFFDLLGVTHLAPWRRALSESFRKLFIWISISCLALSVFTGATMACWRGISLTQIVPEAQASQADSSYVEKGGMELGGENIDLGESYTTPGEDAPPIDHSSEWIVL